MPNTVSEEVIFFCWLPHPPPTLAPIQWAETQALSTEHRRLEAVWGARASQLSDPITHLCAHPTREAHWMRAASLGKEDKTPTLPALRAVQIPVPYLPRQSSPVVSPHQSPTHPLLSPEGPRPPHPQGSHWAVPELRRPPSACRV